MRLAQYGRIAVLSGSLALVGFPGFADAAPASDSDRKAALLPLQVEGDLNAGWRDRIVEDLSRGMVQAGVEVVGPEAVLEASGGIKDCNNAKCYAFLSSSVGARFLLRSRISVDERNYSVSIDIIDGNDGSIAASSSESCQLCGLSEVGDLVTKQAAALRQKVDMLALEPAVVAITSDPSGATIYIDGTKVGTTPMEQALSPGGHRAEARKDGFVTQTRELKTVQGVREALSFELLPEGAEDEGKAKGGGKRWKVPVGWALLGVGVAGTAAGVTFLVIDENPYQARCSGPDVDAMGNCRQRYNTLVHGAVLTATGGALLVTGMALLIRDRVERGRKREDVASRLRVGPGTLGVRF